MNGGRPFTMRARSLVLALALAGLTGCGQARDSAPVAGRVTLNGKPQEGIFVYFSLVPGPKSDLMNLGTPSSCRTDAEGRYALRFMDNDRDGALIGANKVELADERTFSDPKVKSRIPRGWTGTFTVPPEGTDEANFEMGKGNGP